MTGEAIVARLFVALPLPDSVSGALADIKPAADTAVRPLADDDLHITLHFLGSADVRRVGDALTHVNARQFALRLGRPGHFALRNKKKILWVGIEPKDELIDLHTKTGDVLRTVGFEPETRAYFPHVTVARLSAKAPRTVIEAFESSEITGRGIEFDCTGFALYASETAPEGARYRVIQSYPLVAPD